jgi:hypothetical protein
MGVDINSLVILNDPTSRLLFEQIVKNRAIRFSDLLTRVEGARGVQLDRARAKHSLDRLNDARLITKLNSPVDDFDTFYVTSDGLEASRKAGID